MKIIQYGLFAFYALLLSGCSHAKYSVKQNSYLSQSDTLRPIVVPRGAIAPKQKPYYAIPSRAFPASSGKPSMLPPGLRHVS